MVYSKEPGYYSLIIVSHDTLPRDWEILTDSFPQVRYSNAREKRLRHMSRDSRLGTE